MKTDVRNMLNAATLTALMGLSAGLSGCSHGEDIPLLAPGGGSDWPADPRWQAVPELAAGHVFNDGAWDPLSPDDNPHVAIVGEGGAVCELRDGDWRTATPAGAADLHTVVCPEAGLFVAVGADGAAVVRTASGWREEATGTTVALTAAVASAGSVWVAGEGGTVLRRQAGAWTTLPSAGDRALDSIATLHDSLFVAVRDAGVRVWDGSDWSDLPPTVWGSEPVRAVAVTSDGRLYALADSVYVRGLDSWHSAADIDFEWLNRLTVKVTGKTLWFGYWGTWWKLDTAFAGQGPATRLEPAGSIIVPRDEGNYLACGSQLSLMWSRDGSIRQDPAGRLDIRGHIVVASGEMLLMTWGGVVRHDGDGVTQVIDSDVLPGLLTYEFRSGCGTSSDDFFLVGETQVYHCRAGQAPEPVGGLPPSGQRGSAVGADGVLHVGTGDGLWQLQGESWRKVLPVLSDQEVRFEVFALGDGRLWARDSNRDCYLYSAGSWTLVLAGTSESVMVAGEGGSVFLVTKQWSEVTGGDSNVLLVLDERAGGLRSCGSQGMGVLSELSIEGAGSRDGMPLIWTRSPRMVFTLAGPPVEADWRLVAGPCRVSFDRIERLPDGRLLALDTSFSEFHLYRP